MLDANSNSVSTSALAERCREVPPASNYYQGRRAFINKANVFLLAVVSSLLTYISTATQPAASAEVAQVY
jgi:hypothetical protein